MTAPTASKGTEYTVTADRFPFTLPNTERPSRPIYRALAKGDRFTAGADGSPSVAQTDRAIGLNAVAAVTKSTPAVDPAPAGAPTPVVAHTTGSSAAPLLAEVPTQTTEEAPAGTVDPAIVTPPAAGDSSTTVSQALAGSATDVAGFLTEHPEQAAAVYDAELKRGAKARKSVLTAANPDHDHEAFKASLKS